MRYDLEVHYRYAFDGELEKDFELHNVVANSLDEAIQKARRLYRYVFAIYHDNIKVFKY